LQMQGIIANSAAVQLPLLTAKMAAKDVTALKKSFARPGFVVESAELESAAKKFAVELGSKHATAPSATWKLLMAAQPEVVLWVAYSTKSANLQAKFHSFFTEWPQAKQRIPYVQMQEMRIVPELKGFDELVERLFFELMDGRLTTVEEIKAFLEPYSPPAPPPTVHLRRARASKKDAKAKAARIKAEEDDASDENAADLDEAASTNDLAEFDDETEPFETGKIEIGTPNTAKDTATKPVVSKAENTNKTANSTQTSESSKSVKSTKIDTTAKKPAAPVKTDSAKQKKDAAKAVEKKVVAKKATATRVVAGKAVAKKATVAVHSASKKAASKPVVAAKKNSVKTSTKAKAKKNPAKTAAKVVTGKKSGTKPVATKASSKKAGTKSVGKASSAKKR